MSVPITKPIRFDPAGGTLKVNVTFDTLFVCTYKLRLKGKNSNTILMTQTGDNTNDQDDIYPLPLPVESNKNRSLWAFMTVIDQAGKGGKYKLTMEIIQDGKVVGSITTKDKNIEGNIVNEVLIVKLIS